jgi:hypothetical protein
MEAPARPQQIVSSQDATQACRQTTKKALP